MSHKRITLSFDNGPSARVTPFVLGELQQRGMAAWFCLVGTQLQASGARDIAHQALLDGHRIANHSMTHRVALGDDPSAECAEREVGDMHALLGSALPDWGTPWFRPFGRGGALGPHLFSAAALDKLTQLEYSVLLWNSVPRDWENPDGWAETALADVSRREHTVVVLHDLPTGAMDQLPRFLDTLGDLGVEVTLDVPSDCLPMRAGAYQWDVASLTR
jgi:peptidoglycan/xylan/chitin deacetylase (PgdA/CDA1 family)